MSDARQRQRIRQFIGAWMRGRDCAPLVDIQAAVLTRFAADALFVHAFWPIVIGGDAAQVRAALRDPLERLVREELLVLESNAQTRFTLRDACWVRTPEWARPGA